MMLPVNYNEISIFDRKSVREQYMLQQNGKCHFCKSSLKEDPPKDILDKKITKRLFPKNFFNNPVHLHHDHNTGMTIGAVHCYCNAVLWEYYGE